MATERGRSGLRTAKFVPGSRPAIFALIADPSAVTSSNSSRSGKDCSEVITASGRHSMPVMCRPSLSRIAAIAEFAATLRSTKALENWARIFVLSTIASSRNIYG